LTPSIFTRIIQGEIPCFKIAENEDFIAFLDVNPLQQGHTLVVPKKQIDYIYDLDDALLAEFHLFAKKIAKAIEHCVPCIRIGIAVIGLEVPHAHIHLVPINDVGDLNFSNQRIQMTKDEFSALALNIRSAL